MFGKNRFQFLLLPALLLTVACRRPQPTPRPAPRPHTLARLGHTIQAGAFAHPENAARFTEVLQQSGLEATYFRAADGLYKVRFGDFATREQAKSRAEALVAAGTLESYYLVMPERPSDTAEATEVLRQELSKTAHTFRGVPYLWGGTDADSGFDCSGFTMTVYRLQGLRLPRSSQAQWAAGLDIPRSSLQVGDLVFFDTRGRGTVSHVGLYVGGNRFIHAPSRGKHIRVESLDDAYYANRFLGARTYLG